MKSILNFCKKYIGLFRHKIFVLVVLSVILALLSITIPYVTGIFIDFIISPNASLVGLSYFCLVFLVVSVLSLLLGYFSSMSTVKVNTSMSYMLNRDVLNHVHDLPFSQLRGKNAASMTQKINSDSVQLTSYSVSVICNIVVNILTLIIPLVLLVVINVYVTILIGVFAAIYIGTYLYMRKKLYETGYAFKEAQALFFGHLNDQLLYFKFIKDNGIANLMLDRLDKGFKHIFSKTIIFQRFNYIFTSLDSLIMTISQIALFLLCGIMVIDGVLTVGQFTIINSYVAIILSSIRYFFGLGRDTQNALVSKTRLQDIMDTKKEYLGTETLQEVNEIDIKDMVCEINDQRIINGLSCRFSKGKLYSIVGANGCGKATLANILLGEHQENQSGTIRYGTQELNMIDTRILRNAQIGFCEQEPVLLGDTMEFNITLGESENVSRLSETMDLLCLNDVINRYPGGLDTQITNDIGLSGGEKQKIAIARVLIKNRPIMIFDEPTSALDKHSKLRLISHLHSIKTNKIIIVITHDQDILYLFDEIISLDDRYDKSKRLD